MSHHTFSLLLRRCIAGAMLVGLAAQAHAQQVVVGATAPLTGPLSLTGKQYYNSLKLAEDDINKAGGVQGKPVKFVFEDAQASNGTAVNAYVKLVQENKPAFTFLTSYSTQNVAVAPEVAKAALPAMYAGGADSVAELGNPWLFRIRPQDSTAAVAMARFVKDDLKLAKPGILYIQNDFGQGGANAAAAFLKEQGLTPVGMEAYGQNDKDMSAQILSLKNKGADVILAFVYPQDGAMLLRQIKMLGIKQPVVASSAAFVPAAMQLLSPRDLENVWGVIDTYLPATEKGKHYAERFKQRFSMDADPYGAAYYDGAMLMAQAMNAVGTDPAKLQQYLREVKDYPGVSHVYRFDDQGNGVHDVAVVKFADGSKDMQFIRAIQVD
ncbi:binding-protein-dependent transport protein [Bordetella trematum]|uniref:Binding-protein-dependent transport protein n=1 Tax=Bordetella trematum TaxID=123899 RepID=A0A157PPI0_9BORD|nr:ABC transporter substrate-binding protein [Bordetella trematum]NNH19266.1 ABC transporter substrate-binding protein [Bordetella trematum]QIM71626.1 ABC transporter substrate-binding protein [Bordetella trematum]CZZ96108.1 binding-protein-dependent transport protein [Bordetella trematum]SAI34789.1 binding-protein-dependent transport protein [Bordetella trematum]SAI70008.1 binding-protein-dependent transport protein [Bordetella trematum]